MSFTAQFHPEDVRKISGWVDPATRYMYVGMDVGHPDERTAYDRVTLVVELDEVDQLAGLAGLRYLLAALTETVDTLEAGAKLRHEAPWPPEQAKAGDL